MTYRAQFYRTVEDAAGNAAGGFQLVFTTATMADTVAPQVVRVSPLNGATGVPVNATVVVAMTEPLNPFSVTATTVTLQSAGGPVPVTRVLSNSGTWLHLTPTGPLAVTTTYSVQLTGLRDLGGNALAGFTSTFQTAASATADTTGPSVTAVSPSHGATNVALTAPISVTFSEPVSPVTITPDTVYVQRVNTSGRIAASVSLNGAGTSATIALSAPLLPLTTYRIVASAQDLVGNPGGFNNTTFTTGAGPADTTAPTVLLITPANGLTDVSVRTPVVVTFSESLNPTTVTNDTIAVFVNGVEQYWGQQLSADNTVVALGPLQVPPASLVTVVVTSGVQDLSGNPLSEVVSQFTTELTGSDTTAPFVVSMRPPSGATNVAPDTSAVLVFSESMQPATTAANVLLAANGVLVNGAVTASGQNQVATFTPLAPLAPNTFAEVFALPGVRDAAGNPLSSIFQSSFRVATDPAGRAPEVVAFEPSGGVVPRNSALTARFSERIDPGTLTASSVVVTGNSTGITLAGTRSLDASGTMFRFTPASTWPLNDYVQITFTSAIRDATGTPLATARTFYVYMYPDAVVDAEAPTVTSVAPANGATGVGLNAELRVRFSEPINPVTVDATTVTLRNPSGALQPCTIAFSAQNQQVRIVPHAPLAANTEHTVTITGVTDIAGNPVVSRTTTFTTGVGADVTRPGVVGTTPVLGTSGVAVNTVVEVAFSEPVDPVTVTAQSVRLSDATLGGDVAATLHVDASGLRAVLTPTAPLAVGRSYYLYVGYYAPIEDVAGNPLVALQGYFNTAFGADTTAPTVVGIAPSQGATGVATNVPVLVRLSEAIGPLSVTAAAVTLRQGATPVVSTVQLEDGNQQIRMVPTAPLAAGTSYTVRVAGLRDVAGNSQAAAVTSSFTTGPGADLVAPTVVATTPSSGATNVPRNAVVTVQFSEAMNPLTITADSLRLHDTTTGVQVAATVTLDASRTTVTLTPTGLLGAGVTYRAQFYRTVEDAAGNPAGGFSLYFTTAP